MSQLISRNISKYLENLVQKSEVLTLDQVRSKDLMTQLRDHFEKYGNEPFVEYEKNNNWFNRTFKRWNVSTRTPMEFRDVGQISNDGPVFLHFSTNYSGGGFKYFHGPAEFAFLDDYFYLGFGVENKDKGVRIYYQNLYVPKRKIESLSSNL